MEKGFSSGKQQMRYADPLILTDIWDRQLCCNAWNWANIRYSMAKYSIATIS
jgi:hypothetical protein